MTKDKKVGYYEIYEDSICNLINHVNKNVTFLFSPKSNEEKEYQLNERIGFRYYDNISNLNDNYFTLVKKYDNRFYILELKNVNSKTELSMVYFQIIKNIIYNKYKEGYYPDGESIIEILAYCYTLMNIKFKNLIFLEPFIPNIKINDSLRDPSPDNFIENTTYGIPIIFNNHISLLLTGELNNNSKKKRYNILIDMSRTHSKNNSLDKFIFSPNIVNNLLIYPKFTLQNKSTCGLWFLGEAEYCFKSETKVNIIYFFMLIPYITFYIFIYILNNFFNIKYLTTIKQI